MRKYRSLSRTEFDAAIALLKTQHPWLKSHVLKPAPGHLKVVADLVSTLEQLLSPSELHRFSTFCITHASSQMSINFRMRHCPKQLHIAINEVVSMSLDRSWCACQVCSAPTWLSVPLRKGSTLCTKHQRLKAYFTEDVRHARKRERAANAQELAEQQAPEVVAAVIAPVQPAPTKLGDQPS